MQFEGGIDDGVERGKMMNRYVFPIFSTEKEIQGFSGRDLKYTNKTLPKQRPKWKHLGSASKWVYPTFLNNDIIKKDGEVILVEGIGDILSLWDGGVKNVLVVFGVGTSRSIFNYLIKINPKKIMISLDDDSGGSFAGNKASKKLEKRLLKYFDSYKIIIHPPNKKDFGEMTKEDILKWKNHA